MGQKTVSGPYIADCRTARLTLISNLLIIEEYTYTVLAYSPSSIYQLLCGYCTSPGLLSLPLLNKSSTSSESATNIETIIIARFIQGLAGSTGAAMVGGTVADVWGKRDHPPLLVSIC